MCIHSWIRSITAAMALLFAVALPGVAQAGDYVVIGHHANPYQGSVEGTRQLLARLFLKQLTAWPDGTAVKIYAAPGSTPEMVAFRDKVLGMNEGELASHWLALKQKTGGTPPRDVASSSVMGKLVAGSPGAFGIMKKADALAAKNLRVLLEID